MIVRKEGSNQSHCDFRVRRSVVLGALQWLVDNNATSALMLTSSLNYLKMAGLCTVTLNNSHEEQNCNKKWIPMMPRLFIPTAPRRMTEMESVRQFVHEHQSNQSPQPTPWPTTGTPMISEFTTEGYTTLFPTGSADFLAPMINAVTVGNFLYPLF